MLNAPPSPMWLLPEAPTAHPSPSRLLCTFPEPPGRGGTLLPEPPSHTGSEHRPLGSPLVQHRPLGLSLGLGGFGKRWVGSCRRMPGTASCISKQGGEEQPRSSSHRAGHSKISALHPTSQNASKSRHFHSLAVQESEENTTFFQRKKKKKKGKGKYAANSPVCVF